MAVESGARPSHTLTGDFRSRPLAVLLAGACERGTSGTFEFRLGARHDSLVMRLGKIAVVRTSEPVAYLGGILYELGTIDMATLNETLLEVARARRLHGAVLRERGAVTHDQLDDALAEQTHRKVHHLFSLPEETAWSFREDVDELAGARDEDRPPIETWPAIWRGLRDQPAAPHVGRTLAKVAGGFHLRDLESVRRFSLAPEELALCERINAQPSTLERLVSTSPLVAARTELLVYLLALGRCIVRIEVQPVGPIELGIEGVRERARRVMKEDAHTSLGLRPDASPEAARAAYFRLARLWHRDKIPAALDEVRIECERVFMRLGEAHRSITDGGLGAWRRADAVMDGTAAANDSLLPPPTERTTLHDVDAALGRNDLRAAEAIARSLTSAGAEGPDARAVLAWCAVEAGANTAPAAVDSAIAALDKILTGDPTCVRALFYRGEVLKRLGRRDDAIRDYRRVLRLDPHHLEAQQEVRLTSTAPAPPAPAVAEAVEDSAMRSGLRRLLARVAGK